MRQPWEEVKGRLSQQKEKQVPKERQQPSLGTEGQPVQMAARTEQENGGG